MSDTIVPSSGIAIATGELFSIVLNVNDSVSSNSISGSTASHVSIKYLIVLTVSIFPVVKL